MADSGVLYVTERNCYDDIATIFCGAKTEQVEAAVKAFSGTFTLYELEHACMEVSRDMVRKVLRDLQKACFVECLGRGPGAVWRKRGNTLKKG